MKKLLYVITIIFLFSFIVKANSKINIVNNYSQIDSIDTTDTIVKTRGTLSLNPFVLLYATPAIILFKHSELFQASYGFNINDNYSISGKVSYQLDKTFPIGLKFSFLFPEKIFWGFDCANVEVMHSFHPKREIYEAYYFDQKRWYFSLNLSKENITEKGINIYWSVGINGAIRMYDNKLLFAPVINMGIAF